jgi:hypothetical protein
VDVPCDASDPRLVVGFDTEANCPSKADGSPVSVESEGTAAQSQAMFFLNGTLSMFCEKIFVCCLEKAVVGVTARHESVRKVGSRLTTFNGTDCIAGSVRWAEAMLIVFKRDGAVQNTAAEMTDGYSVYDDDMYFFYTEGKCTARALTRDILKTLSLSQTHRHFMQ